MRDKLLKGTFSSVQISDRTKSIKLMVIPRKTLQVCEVDIEELRTGEPETP